MKLVFNLANSHQQQAIGPMDAATFLQMEKCSKIAFGAAISMSIETCPGNIKQEDLVGLLGDFGRMPSNDSELFERLLKQYFVNCFHRKKELADAGWQMLSHFFTDHSADKAFRRLVERNVALVYGDPVTQGKLDKFVADVKAATTFEWE